MAWSYNEDSNLFLEDMWNTLSRHYCNNLDHCIPPSDLDQIQQDDSERLYDGNVKGFTHPCKRN